MTANPPEGNIPVPDPSVLTTDAVREAVTALRAVLEAELNSLRLELNTFREGHEEKHVSVVSAAITHRKELSDASIAILKAQVDAQHEAHQEQIRSLNRDVELRFDATDLRYQQRYDSQSQAVKDAFDAQQEATAASLTSAREAVTAALAAAEKAILKAEQSTEKLIPRAEVETRLGDVVKQIAVLETTIIRRFATQGEAVERLQELTQSINSIGPLTEAKFVTMRTLIDSQAEKVALALAASDKAVTKAELATEKRFEAVNEFRQQLNDQAHSFVMRAEYNATQEGIADKIDELRKYANTTSGRSQGMSSGWGYLVGVISVIVVVVNVIIALATK